MDGMSPQAPGGAAKHLPVDFRSGPAGSYASSLGEVCPSSTCQSPFGAGSFASVGPTNASEWESESPPRRRKQLWIDPDAQEGECMDTWEKSALPSYVPRGMEHTRTTADLVFSQWVEINRKDRRREQNPIAQVVCPPEPCWQRAQTAPDIAQDIPIGWGSYDDEEEELTNEFEATSAPAPYRSFF